MSTGVCGVPGGAPRATFGRVIPDDLRTRADNRGAALGAWISLREPLAAEVASRAGYDYVCIDMQHGLADLDMMGRMLTAVAVSTSLPIVRVPWNEPGAISRALDAGALGVIVPMVNTADEAAAVVAAAKYPPLGARSYGPLAARARFGDEYVARANDLVAVIPMIETAEAVDNVEAIAAVPGVDGLYIGPADLSISIGLAPAGDQDDRRFVDALERTVAACRRHGILPGIHASAELAAKRRQQGFRFITVGFDFGPMSAGLTSALRTAAG